MKYEIFEDLNLDNEITSSDSRLIWLMNLRIVHLTVFFVVAGILLYISSNISSFFVNTIIFVFSPIYIISLLALTYNNKIQDKFSTLYIANILIDIDIFLVAVLSYMFGGISGPMIYFFVYIVFVSGYLLPPKSSLIHAMIALSVVGVFLILHKMPQYIEHDLYCQTWLLLSHDKIVLSHGFVISVVIVLSAYVGSYIYSNVRKQEEMLEDLFAVAYHHSISDSLTGLYDQQFFRKRLQEMLYWAKKESKKISVIMVDVDYFKQYNDANGHLKGSETLKKVAHILSSSIRKRKGDIASRYGGDEFIMMLVDADKKVLENVCRRIVDKVESEKFEGEEISQPLSTLTISAGGATFPDDHTQCEDANELIDIADKRLYIAKQTGKNKFIIHNID